MEPNTDKLIRELAEKLGTTGEHLWGVLVAQAPIAAISSLATYAAFLLGLCVAWWGVFRAYKACVSDHCEDEFWDYSPGFFVLAALSLVWIGCFCDGAGTIAAGFFNPEYWAFKQIVH